MTELVRFGEDTRRLRPVDDWAYVLEDVGEIARKIAGTDFVPKAYRGNVAAVAACVLAGREIGLQPMAALREIYIVNGTPGLKAEAMRALSLAAGHEIRYETSTDTRCVVKGRRRGEEEWTEVTFTAEQASKAGIKLGDYPEDKLLARATSRLCRRIFADCLGGMPYAVEELEEGTEEETVPRGRRTAQRAPRPLRMVEPPSAVQEAPTGSAGYGKPDVYADELLTPATPVVDVPPLPEPAPVEDDPLDERQLGPVEADDFPDPYVPLSPGQRTAIIAALSGFGIIDRDERLHISAALAGRLPLGSSNELSKADASAVLDTLTQLQQLHDPMAGLRAVIGLGVVDRQTVVRTVAQLEE